MPDEPPAAAPARDLAAPLSDGVIFRSPLAGIHRAANVFAGVLVCALLGALLGLGMGGMGKGALLGVVVAFGGALFVRRERDEIVPRAIELGDGASVRVVVAHEAPLLLSAGDVADVAAEVGEGDARRPWVVIARRDGAPLRVRARDGAEAERVAAAIREALGMPPAAE